MTLLLNLYLGHLLGDFVLQPGWLVAAKRRSVAGLLTHVGVIGGGTAIIIYSDLSTLWNIVLLAMAAHIAIETITIRARASTQLSGLSVFLIDQALHITSLVALVWLAAPEIDPQGVSTLGFDLSARAIALMCAIVGVTFMGAVIVFETGNSVGRNAWNQAVLPWDAARIFGMAERGAALVLASLVHPALILVPFLPRIASAARQSAEKRSREILIAATGLVVCLLGWALVAGVSMTSARVF